MQTSDRSGITASIHRTLWQLGVTTNYRGFFYTTYAAQLCAEEPETLHFLTKWLYPQVAKRYHTNWKSVERNIRTVVDVAWRRNPEMMCCMAGCGLKEKPPSGQFLSMLANWALGPEVMLTAGYEALAAGQN